MTSALYILLLLTAGAGVFLALRSPRGLTRFTRRGCAGRAWKSRFPDASKEEIRTFLDLFAMSFCARSRDRLRFFPEDGIHGIYRELYPRPWTPDALELETFAKGLQERYGVDLTAFWGEDLTLGDCFERVRQPR